MPLYHDGSILITLSESAALLAGQVGNDFKEEARPLPGETVIAKSTTNAFIGTGLEKLLRARHQSLLVISGVITNNSVEVTARMAGNLGFSAYVVSDATFTFDKTDWDGRSRTAEEVHAMSLANLHGEYATVVTTTEVLDAVSRIDPQNRSVPDGAR